jgi:hypothetical protein
MREITGLAVSTLLFYLSKRMGIIIKLTGRGWRPPYRAYYKLVHAAQRVRTWGQSTPGNSEQGEQLKLDASPCNSAHFADGRIITLTMGRVAHLASRGRGANLFSDSGNESGAESGNKTVVRQGGWSSDTDKPYGRHTGQT